ncbi:FGGY family carbohydrate kinase [Dyadobacter sp. LHD-138]|uniref:FGGY-family carbohydrate kinase n=1 Tax=Dyadobacter sp. LHD-138 TaxID=3071413 RepID=UPI0027DFE4FD|nr:FGGY family carbohydrate kinase [Dyadobacter sp. LHD-138]MDQ6480061.1 FGGY family carbohydrate kinase [Dyadobacter sp. LHD-138]
MIPKQAYLIIDIGTGNVRVAVAENSGNILSVESDHMHYEKDYAYPESIYFDPDALWEQLVSLAKVALSKAGDVKILAITATSQREGIVAIDKSGNAMIGMPNIDHRGREWENIAEDKQEIYQRTGRYPTSLFSALKLVGLEKRQPELWQNFETFLSISDWAQFKLSGIKGYEHSQASETLLYDVAEGKWSERLCTIYGLNPNILPPLHASGTILGDILPDIARDLSISGKAQIVVGGSDTQLAILSIHPSVDDVVVVSGTTTPIIKITDRYITDEQERTWTSRHTDPSSFLLEANAGVTGLNYQRLKDIFYPNEGYEIIEKEVENISNAQTVAALGSLLADEKTPLIRGGFVFNTPVSHQLTRGDFVFATLWDITCSIFENYKSLCQVSGHSLDYIWVCGGGVQSRVLRQFIANLTGKKVMIRDNYRQASVVGGVFVCNQALGIATEIPPTLEVVSPQPTEQEGLWYDDWKKTRLAFKSTLCP